MHLLKILALVAMACSACACSGRAAAAGAEAPEKQLALPSSGIMKVAFVVSDRATLIDIAGPMQVFDQVQSPGTTGFQTYTVSETRQPIKAGTLTIVPDYTFADAPDPDIVVVGAQTGRSEPYLNFIRGMTARGKLMLSVCTGAAKFADAGILDGLPATSHHDYIDGFAKTYPKIGWLRDRSYVHSAPMIYTAGGETSGIELALHITELYFDHDIAVKTARYMEYRGPAWQK
ncbi:DJ-1/PfpI family protein [Sphingomonas sp.]|uniref:DJ-1/PfpI family protein n=1 Tax=Sphingomonas sp. TaxID=28214 RepID=UPI0038AEE27A